MNGAMVTSGAFLGAAGSSTVAGVGDFDGDGKSDILLRDSAGDLGIWFIIGNTVTSGAFVGSARGYIVPAVNDYSGDGKADILLKDADVNVGMWIMNGSTIVSGVKFVMTSYDLY
jgi:hypothetical protein